MQVLEVRVQRLTLDVICLILKSSKSLRFALIYVGVLMLLLVFIEEAQVLFRTFHPEQAFHIQCCRDIFPEELLARLY